MYIYKYPSYPRNPLSSYHTHVDIQADFRLDIHADTWVLISGKFSSTYLPWYPQSKGCMFLDLSQLHMQNKPHPALLQAPCNSSWDAQMRLKLGGPLDDRPGSPDAESLPRGTLTIFCCATPLAKPVKITLLGWMLRQARNLAVLSTTVPAAQTPSLGLRGPFLAVLHP